MRNKFGSFWHLSDYLVKFRASSPSNSGVMTGGSSKIWSHFGPPLLEGTKQRVLWLILRISGAGSRSSAPNPESPPHRPTPPEGGEGPRGGRRDQNTTLDEGRHQGPITNKAPGLVDPNRTAKRRRDSMRSTHILQRKSCKAHKNHNRPTESMTH
jgi:hypothetical protein